MRLDNATTVFLTEWPAEGIAKDTIRTYRSVLQWLCGFALEQGAVYLADLTPSLLRAAMVAKMQPPAEGAGSWNWKGGEATAASLAHATRKLARWALAQGLQVPDLSAVKAPRVPKRVQPRLYPNEFSALETAVLRRLINGSKRVPRVAVTRDLALLNVLGETGLRAQEVCGLEIEDVDFERGEICVRRGKGKKERWLSIIGVDSDDDPYRVLRLLAEWLETRSTLRLAGQHRKVWTSIRGTKLSDGELRRVLGRMCLEAGFSGNRPPHAFRRYMFTEHYRERPGAIRQLSDRMGWSPNSHTMVDVYTRGVELEFSREPMPLLSNRLALVPPRRAAPFYFNGVGPPGGGRKLNDRAAPSLAQRRANPAASQARSKADRRYEL